MIPNLAGNLLLKWSYVVHDKHNTMYLINNRLSVGIVPCHVFRSTICFYVFLLLPRQLMTQRREKKKKNHPDFASTVPCNVPCTFTVYKLM
jgi:hypothetical protein